MNSNTGGILSDEITEDIVLRLIMDSGEEGMLEKDIASIVNWIEEAVLNHDLVQLFMEGKLSITWGDGEPIFKSRASV